MVNHANPLLRDVIAVGENRAGAFGHHDQCGAAVADACEHFALTVVWFGEHGVQRRHHGLLDPLQQFEQVRARLSTEQPELMLQADRLEPAVVEEIGGVAVVVLSVLADFERDFRAVAVELVLIVDGDDSHAIGGLERPIVDPLGHR
jgi:hypothetical protein